MVVDSSRSIGPATGAAASGLDLSSLSAGRQMEARVTALAGQMATLASRHGTLEVDLGKAKVAVGDVLRFEVQAVPGGDGKSGIRLELLPSEQQTASAQASSPAVDPARAALARAVARAVTTQSGLAPLYGALTGLSNAPAGSVPDPVRSIVDQILGGRLAASVPVSAASVAAAFRNSGLFTESTRAAAGGAALPAGDQDLKATFTALRDALAKWVGNTAAGGSSTATAGAGAATTAAPTSGNAAAGSAAAGQAGATVQRPASGGEAPASASGLAVRAAYGGAGQPASPTQAQTPTPTSAPATTSVPTQTAGQTQTTPATPAQSTAGPVPAPDVPPDERGRLAAVAYRSPVPAARAAVPSTSGQTVGQTGGQAATVATPGGAASGATVAPSPGGTPSPASTPVSAATASPPPAAGSPVPANPAVAPAGGEASTAVSREASTPPAGPSPSPAAPTTGGAAAAAPGAVGGAAPSPVTPQVSATAPTDTAPATSSATPAATPAPGVATPAAPAAAEATPTPATASASPAPTGPSPAGPVPTEPAAPSAGAATTAPVAAQAPPHPAATIAGPTGGAMPIRESVPPPAAAEGTARPSQTVAADRGVVVVPPAVDGDEQALAAAFRLARAVAADLGLAAGAADEAASLAAGISASPRERAGKVPPPRKGAAPIAQDPAVDERADTAKAAEQLARKTLERADGALQRILLEQWAVLDTSGEAAASVQRGGKEWTAELPLATRDGTSIVQMTVERDGKQGGQAGEPSKVGWRVRFALDVEPIGPIHAQIGLSGEHLSVGLWIERPEMAEILAADIGSLTSALADGGSVLEAVHVTAGEPPVARAEPQSASGHFIDVSL